MVLKPTPEESCRRPQCRRLTIPGRPKSRFYQARTFLDGKWDQIPEDRTSRMAETKAIDSYKPFGR